MPSPRGTSRLRILPVFSPEPFDYPGRSPAPAMQFVTLRETFLRLRRNRYAKDLESCPAIGHQRRLRVPLLYLSPDPHRTPQFEKRTDPALRHRGGKHRRKHRVVTRQSDLEKLKPSSLSLRTTRKPQRHRCTILPAPFAPLPRDSPCDSINRLRKH